MNWLELRRNILDSVRIIKILQLGSYTASVYEIMFAGQDNRWSFSICALSLMVEKWYS